MRGSERLRPSISSVIGQTIASARPASGRGRRTGHRGHRAELVLEHARRHVAALVLLTASSELIGCNLLQRLSTYTDGRSAYLARTGLRHMHALLQNPEHIRARQTEGSMVCALRRRARLSDLQRTPAFMSDLHLRVSGLARRRRSLVPGALQNDSLRGRKPTDYQSRCIQA